MQKRRAIAGGDDGRVSRRSFMARVVRGARKAVQEGAVEMVWY